jgi:phospholipase C
MKHRLVFGCLAAAFAVATAGALADDRDDDHRDVITKTPIKHLVVIFQENISFDHYFGTYPQAQNNSGETAFHASPRTPKSINNLLTPLDTTNHFVPLVGVDLLNHNPNAVATNPVAPNNSKQNGVNASNPFRLSPAQALTADQGHNDSPEQSAYNNGHMDGFPAWVGTAGPPPVGITTRGLVMGYYDGNTVTALWNYAQHFAMSDNSYVTQFGPSSPGAIDLVAGQANGFAASQNIVSGTALLHPTHEVFDGNGNFTLIGDADPLGDVCSASSDQVTLAGKNIGDLLNAKGISWGWFEGGFDLSVVNPNSTTGCARETNPTAPGTPAFTSADYIPHHQPFQYYASTRNETHARPSSVAAIGHSFIPHTHTPEPANHQYDTNDFFAALAAHNLPAVTFLKAPAFQDGHAGYSDPLDEQHFLVQVLNALQKTEEWESTAVIIAYDDSDGWYDHQMPPIVNPSFIGVVNALPSPVTVDTLNGPGLCNHGFQQGSPTPSTPLNGNAGLPAGGRCGYGTRAPLLVVSPYAKANFVDHTLTDQSSILRFIEDNWLAGERIQPHGSFDTIAGTLENMFDFRERHEEDPRKLFLDETTGAVVKFIPDDDDRN